MHEVLAIQLTRKPFSFEAFETHYKNRETTTLWLPQSSEVAVYENTTLYKRTFADEEGFVEWYFAVSKDGLSRYVVKIVDVKAPPLRAACQVGVWSDNAFAVPRRLAPLVFWGVLFAKHDMISDQIQTDLGRRFWLSRVVDAYEKNLCVYWLRMRGSKILEVKRLRDIDTFNESADAIWGTDLKMRNTRLAITQHALKFE